MSHWIDPSPHNRRYVVRSTPRSRHNPSWVPRLVVAWLLLARFLSASGAVLPPAIPDARPDRLLVKFRGDVDPATQEAFHTSQGTVVLRKLTSLDGWQVVRLAPGASLVDTLGTFTRSSIVEAAEPDWYVHACILPNDPSATNGTQWPLLNLGINGGIAGADIDAEAAWDAIRSIPDTIVAVIDSGIRETHRDLTANLWTNLGEIPGNGVDDDKNGYVDDIHGFNAIDSNGDLKDEAGHGTHIAGIIGGAGNNGVGICGVAWNVRILTCKFMDATGNGAVSDAALGIDYARQHGATVVNASWASPTSSSVLRTAIDKARQAGIIVVSAAGNDGGNNDVNLSYPGAFNLGNIVTVAATTQADQLADFSNFGATSVDLAAPGAAVYSASNAGDAAYIRRSGTSMSAPHVTGAIALLRARHPSETVAKIITRLLAATDPLPTLAGKCSTGGRLNLAKALVPNSIAEFTVSTNFGMLPLTVQFTDQSIGTVVKRVWNFGDDTPEEVIKNPSHVFSREGTFNVQLTVYPGEGPPNTRTRTIRVVATMNVEPVPFDWVDPSTFPALTLGNNDVSAAQPIQFPFSFYGQSYTQAFIGANGIVGFLNASLNSTANVDIPAVTSPNAALFPYWDDLDPGAGGSVRVGTLGNGPNRRMIISWVQVPLRSRPTVLFTLQAILEETSNAIAFQYLDVTPAQNNGGGRGATIGIENETGLIGSRFSFNGSTVLSNKVAVRFAPAVARGLAVDPIAGVNANGPAGGPFLPASWKYRLTNTSDTPFNWVATNSQPWLKLSPPSGSLAGGASVEVTATLQPAAATLAQGIYSTTVAFVNKTTNIGNTVRTATLAVTEVVAEPAPPELGFDPVLPPVLRLRGSPSTPYVVESTDDLKLWIAVSTNETDAAGSVVLPAPDTGSNAARFLRARTVASPVFRK